MLTRSVHILCLTLTAATLVTPSAWVLCMEPTGEVRVELAGNPCCDGESPDVPATRPEVSDCDGCSDVSVTSPGLRAARASCGILSNTPASCALVPPPVAHASRLCAVQHCTHSEPAPYLTQIAATVITC